MLDNQKYRYQNNLKERSISIWTYVNDNYEKFLNPFYEKYNKRLEIKADYITLHFWKEYFLQWTEFSDSQDDSDCFVQSDSRADLLKEVLEENKKLKKQISEYEASDNTSPVTLTTNGHV